MQGRTAAGAIVHIGGKTDAKEIYVALTRHRQEAHIVVDCGRLDAACRLRQEDSRIQPTRIAMLERLFAETRHYREKANVIDYVSDRAAFIADGFIKLPEPELGWSARLAMRASRELSALLQPLQRAILALGKSIANELSRPALPKHLDILRQQLERRNRTPQPRQDAHSIER